MSQLTRKLIVEKTLEMATKKPVGKITVREIVSECEITRNTFYYYFHDVYHVLDSALMDQIEDNRKFGDQFEDRMFDLMEKVTKYKKVWQNLYASMGREEMTKYVTNKLHAVLKDYIASVTENHHVSAKDKDIVVAFYEEALVGIFFRWIQSYKGTDDNMDLLFVTERIRVLFEGQIELVIENAERNPAE